MDLTADGAGVQAGGEPAGGEVTKNGLPGPLPAEAAKAQPIVRFDPSNPAAHVPAPLSAASPAGYPQPLGSPDAAVPPTPGARVQRGTRLKRFHPADPFDPEIFNRRYFSDGKTRKPDGETPETGKHGG